MSVTKHDIPLPVLINALRSRALDLAAKVRRGRVIAEDLLSQLNEY